MGIEGLDFESVGRVDDGKDILVVEEPESRGGTSEPGSSDWSLQARRSLQPGT